MLQRFAESAGISGLHSHKLLQAKGDVILFLMLKSSDDIAGIDSFHSHKHDYELALGSCQHLHRPSCSLQILTHLMRLSLALIIQDFEQESFGLDCAEVSDDNWLLP